MKKIITSLMVVLMTLSVHITVFAAGKVSFKLGNILTLILSIIFCLISGFVIVVSWLNHMEISGRTIATFCMSVLIIFVIASGGSLSNKDDGRLETIEEEINESEKELERLKENIENATGYYELEKYTDEYYEEMERYTDMVDEYNSILE